MKEIYSVIDRFCKVTLGQDKDGYAVHLLLFSGGELSYKFTDFDKANQFYDTLLEGIYET